MDGCSPAYGMVTGANAQVNDLDTQGCTDLSQGITRKHPTGSGYAPRGAGDIRQDGLGVILPSAGAGLDFRLDYRRDGAENIDPGEERPPRVFRGA